MGNYRNFYLPHMDEKKYQSEDYITLSGFKKVIKDFLRDFFRFLSYTEFVLKKSWYLILVGMFSGLLMGNIFPAAFEVVSADTRASAVGILNFCGAILSGFGTLFGGLWKQSLGIDGLLTLTAVAYVVAGIGLVIGIKALFPRDFIASH